MAKQPAYRVRDIPGSGGPLAVVPTNADAPGRALAGIGRGVQRLGEFLTVEAKEAEEKTRRLQQATEVSRFGMEAVGDYNKLQDELASEQDPDKRYPRYEETQARIRSRLDAITDPDVRAQAETWLNEESAVWDADVRTGTQKQRVTQADQHLAALGADGIRRRDISQIQLYADKLVAGGFISEQQKTDLVGQYDATIQSELVKDAITATTLSQASHADQTAYLKGLSRPAQLTDQEWADFRDGLFAKLDVDRATAAQQERQVALAVEANDRKILADAWRGQLDVAGSLQMMEEGKASAAVVNQAVAMARKGPTPADDPDTYMEAERWLTKIRRDPAQKEKALAWLKSNATKLTPNTWQGYVSSYEKAGDPADPLADPQYKLLDGLIDDNFFTEDGSLTFGQYKGAEAERAYILAKQQFRRYRTEHADATQDELNTEYERLFAVPERVTIGNRIWDWIKLSAPGYGPGLALSRYLYGPEESQPTATLTRPQEEPLTQQDFEEAVKAFAPGSKEQLEYYRKWAGKWQ